MEKVKENMYVRYKNFGKCEKIAKIKEILPPDDKFDFTYYRFNDIQGTIENCIIKASYFVIDLIDIGDYVNGEKVIAIDDLEGCMREYHVEGENPETDCGHWLEEIKSVVTKEQFKNMEYEVE